MTIFNKCLQAFFFHLWRFNFILRNYFFWTCGNIFRTKYTSYLYCSARILFFAWVSFFEWDGFETRKIKKIFPLSLSLSFIFSVIICYSTNLFGAPITVWTFSFNCINTPLIKKRNLLPLFHITVFPFK